MFEVILSESSSDFYVNAEMSLKKKLQHCFETLKINPYKHNNIKKLKGDAKEYFRYRIGDFRVVYRIESGEKLIIVLIIAHRSKVYKKL